MKAIVYARVSTKEQNQEDGHSIEAQINDGCKYDAKKDLTVIGEPFRIVESSAANGRPEFNKMVQFVKKQSSKIIIICNCVDRLQRDFDEQYLELQKLIKADKVEIHYTQNGFIEHKIWIVRKSLKRTLMYCLQMITETKYLIMLSEA